MPLNVSQAHYQALLIIYQKFIAKVIESVRKKKFNQYVIL